MSPGSAVPLSDRLGIYQGRLVESTNGELQCSPGARWADEVELAGRLGFAHVEVLAEGEPNDANPIWSREGRAAMRSAFAAAGLGVVSLCVDEPTRRPLAGAVAASELAGRLAAVLPQLPFAMIVLPLYEASDPEIVGWVPVATALTALARALGPLGARLVVETSLPAQDAMNLLQLVDAGTVGLCYDIGNRTADGFVPEEELPVLAPAVWHVHCKDKDARGANVRLGAGEVAFRPAFDALRSIGYAGAMTLETTRGDDPVATAAAHRAFVLDLDRQAVGR